MERKRPRLTQKSYRFEGKILDEIELESEVRRVNGIEPASQNAIVNEALKHYFEHLRNHPPLKAA